MLQSNSGVSVPTHSQSSTSVQTVQRKDPYFDTLEPRLALAEDLTSDEVHALGVVREAAGVSSSITLKLLAHL